MAVAATTDTIRVFLCGIISDNAIELKQSKGLYSVLKTIDVAELGAGVLIWH
jgi:hypothetical protein